MGNFTVYTSSQAKKTGGISSVLGHFHSFDNAFKAGETDIIDDECGDKYFSIYEKGKTGHIYHSNEKNFLGKRA